VQPSTIPEALIAAYRATAYTSRINDADDVMTIGEKAIWLANLYDTHGASTALFITAENPFSETRTLAENAEAQARLRQCLLKATDIVFDGWGTGADTDWPPEKSFLALGLSLEAARALGMQFHQNAVIWAGADAIPQLILLT